MLIKVIILYIITVFSFLYAEEEKDIKFVCELSKDDSASSSSFLELETLRSYQFQGFNWLLSILQQKFGI